MAAEEWLCHRHGMEATQVQMLRQTIEQISQRLRDLPSASKLLIGSLMVILVMGLFLVGQYAGSSARVELSIDPEAQAEAMTYMRSVGIEFEPVNGKLMVPKEQQITILAQLTEREITGGDTINFESLLKQDSPFLSRDQSQKHWLTAKMNVLSRMITQMSGVKSATVVIDEPSKPSGLGMSYTAPSASVNVVMKSGEMSQELVDAVARLVAGAHAGLKPEHVAVSDAMANKVRKTRGSDDFAAGTNLEHKIKTEHAVQTKIEEYLSYIPGVKVAVNAMVDTRDMTVRSDSYKEAVVGPLAERSSTSTSSSTTGGAEPGVRTNTGVSLSTGGKSGTTSSQEQNEAKMDPRFPAEHSLIRDAKGFALKVNATIGIPRSFLVRVFREQKKDEKAEPDDAAITAIEQQHRPQIEKGVQALIDTQGIEGATKGDVVVSVIPDFAILGAGGSMQAELAPMSWAVSGGPMDGVIKMAGLGALAVVSLLMMFLMIRKANVQEALPSAQDLAGIPPPIQLDESDMVGEADESAPALEGMELDDDALRRQQMLGQINDMVNKNPDEAAALVRRWMKSEQ
jgi:flagellar M-ring protein FliF